MFSAIGVLDIYLYQISSVNWLSHSTLHIRPPQERVSGEDSKRVQ